jgi:hypothetical protein
MMAHIRQLADTGSIPVFATKKNQILTSIDLRIFFIDLEEF